MDDLISRQAAIDAVYERIRQIGYENNPLVLSIKQTIRDLPSAQPEKRTEKRTETRACDLIPRQAAIDALGDGALVNYQAAGHNNGLVKAIDVIKGLPSAQKKGWWVHDGYDFPGGVDWIHCSECGKRGINVPADLSNFCPNCGADMRGEK